jgi:hypothetical protein
MNSTTPDRYLSFEGLECDRNATQIMSAVRHHLEHDATPQQWQNYFAMKFGEQQRMGTDDLFFVGSQMNTLYAFFEELADEAARELLYQVEQECC